MYVCINLVPFASLLITCLAGRIYDGEMTKAEYFPHHLTVKKRPYIISGYSLFVQNSGRMTENKKIAHKSKVGNTVVAMCGGSLISTK